MEAPPVRLHIPAAHQAHGGAAQVGEVVQDTVEHQVVAGRRPDTGHGGQQEGGVHRAYDDVGPRMASRQIHAPPERARKRARAAHDLSPLLGLIRDGIGPEGRHLDPEGVLPPAWRRSNGQSNQPRGCRRGGSLDGGSQGAERPPGRAPSTSHATLRRSAACRGHGPRVMRSRTQRARTIRGPLGASSCPQAPPKQAWRSSTPADLKPTSDRDAQSPAPDSSRLSTTATRGSTCPTLLSCPRPTETKEAAHTCIGVLLPAAGRPLAAYLTRRTEVGCR